ncbi:class III lanthionine synthetase LanKC [Streptomyces sp. NPDC048172]|uniref:class III lanthionine synthetase LanKC n=1 Tax=Streptomyces sp. NPDC048172 TaxID=3365505 RepID=UPI003719FFCF
MEKRYEVFCLADRWFYDTPDRLPGRGAVAAPFAEAEGPAPEGWERLPLGEWLYLQPTGYRLPHQGWKIHVSAAADNAATVLRRTWKACVERRAAFKFLPAPHLLHLRNSKYAPRGSSGKFITVYADGEAALKDLLDALGTALDGEHGPYVLSDLRIGNAPLYVRYGGFTRRYCLDSRGDRVLALEDGDGNLVPDERGPVFTVPEWAETPVLLQPHLTARAATTVAGLPYEFDGALHFSNGGGVYTGRDRRTGERVVLKEARPHAGLASDGADAVTRLERERDALRAVDGLGVAPGVRDWLTVGDHCFLVQEFIEGRTLNSFLSERHPLITDDPDPGRVARYTDWALGIHRAVADAVAGLHGRGYAFNDLHMFNIMVRPDESVALIDFEAAAPLSEERRQAVAHPAFLAPPDRTGAAVDDYALACLKLALFLPLTSLLAIDRTKARHLARTIAAHFPVPPDELAATVAEITGSIRASVGVGVGDGGGRAADAEEPDPLATGLADWPRARDVLARSVLASATPERSDRLFPGDIPQFAGEGLGMACGASGVLYALSVTGAGRYERGEEWLLRACAHPGDSAGADPAEGPGLGFYDGLAGAAFALHHLGHTQPALDLAELILGERWDRLSTDLYGGLPGLGLALDHLAAATGEPALREAASRAALLTADRLRPAQEPARPRSRPRPRLGLLRGRTGAALLFLRLHARGADTGLLDAAAEALRHDLGHCVADADGAWQIDEGFRTMPYLGAGSAGLGAVLDTYLAVRPDPEFEAAREPLARAALSHFYAQPGLFRGRAGMVLALARTDALPPGVREAALARQIDALSWYAVPYGGGLAFPGDQLMRLSSDLATGTAGVLLALGAALRGTAAPVHLPFLAPPADPEGGPQTVHGTGTTPPHTERTES